MRGGRRLAALAVAAAIGAGAELLARGADIRDPTAAAAPANGEVMLDGNPWLLWELAPGVHREKGVTVHVNEAGFRGPTRGPKQRPRALALGDSSVYGFGVEDDEVFTAVLEARGDAEYVNAAVPGFSSYQALNLLQMRGLAFDPDIALVGTIWSDNNFDSFTDRDLVASYAGWEASWEHDARVILERSAIFRWLDWTFRVAPHSEAARKVGWQVGGDDPRTGNRRVALPDYIANLDAFCRLMHARGGGVVFLMLANREDIDNLAPEPAWDVYRRAMRDTADRWGAPLVDVPAAFRATGRSADALFLDQMHPTALGHRTLAEAVATALSARGWPAAPLRLVRPDRPPALLPDPFQGRGIERSPVSPPGRP